MIFMNPAERWLLKFRCVTHLYVLIAIQQVLQSGRFIIQQSALSFLNYNGQFYNEDEALISANNRSFRYGDGFFETMKMLNEKIILRDYHFERLFSSLELMQFEKPGYFTPEYFEHQIKTLVEKNNHSKITRVRLMIFRGDGELYGEQNNFPNYIIQTWQRSETYNQLNNEGFVIDIFKDARKACDNYSHIKHNNYLLCVMAALWAKKNNLNDALVLNPYERIADATIANIFIVKDGRVKTPALTEGCISGVVRRYLLKCMREEGIPVEETSIIADDVLQAREVFLTNTAYGIRWVRKCGKSEYANDFTQRLYKEFVVPLYNSAM
jgi:branched-chain amino acid aminotransferase